MKYRNITLRVFSVLVVGMAVAACEAEVALETAPGAIVRAGGCQGTHLDPGGPEVSGPWGTATPVQKGVEYNVNAGYTVTICAKGGPDNNTATITGPASGTVSTPTNPGGQPPDLSHWSVYNITGGGTTLAPSSTAPATTAGGGDTTIPGPSTTISGETTLTQGEVTTTADGGSTTTQGGATTTVPDSGTTLPDTDVTTTIPDSGTTLPDSGATTTLADDQTTTTAEVGAGTLEPGQETSTTGEGGGTGDPGDTTTTASDDVEGGASESTLPYTGAGDMTTGGMAGLLVGAGIVLLLFARRKSDAE
jgi:LPXTG-motif cell wall-anchored protein